MKSSGHRVVLRVPIVLLFLVLVPDLSDGQSTSEPHWKLMGATGIGAVYENVGVAGSFEASRGHLVAEVRYAAMLPDGGSEPNWVHLPRETVSDYALMAGYGFLTRKGFAQFTVGPAYSTALIRGTTLVQTHYAPFLALLDSNSRTYDSSYLSGLGYTFEALFGMKFSSSMGAAFRVFYTAGGGFSYSGLFLNLIFGQLQ